MLQSPGPTQGHMTCLSCEALLFDLDGVLVDSTACIEHMWRQWSAQHGLDPTGILRIAHGRRALEIVGIAAPHLNAAAEMATLVAEEARTTLGICEVSGARELLHTLPPDRWAVVTSGRARSRRAPLTACRTPAARRDGMRRRGALGQAGPRGLSRGCRPPRPRPRATVLSWRTHRSVSRRPRPAACAL